MPEENKQQEAKNQSTPEAETKTVDTNNAETKETVTDAPAETGDKSSASGQAKDRRESRGGGRRGKDRRQRRSGRREERQRPEFEQKIISIRRVTRVMAGGRRFSFSVSMVIGDKKGRVGVGLGKAGDTQQAIEKAVRDAKKHMITVPMDKEHRIAHDVEAKYASSEVSIMPAIGRGLVAGSSVRTVLELAGVKDVTAKLFSRTKNKLNNARATIEALMQLKN